MIPKFFFLINKYFYFFFSILNIYNFINTYILKKLLYFNFKNFFFYTYFILNFTRLQEFFSLVFFTFKLFKAFSSGFLLRLFSILEKKNRRVVKKHVSILIFLKIFFFKVLKKGSEVWFINFKKKYIPIIYELAH